MTRDPSLPMLVVHDDSAVHVMRELPMKFLKDCLTTSFTIFTREGQARPTRVIDSRPIGTRAFGKELVAVTFEWSPFEPYDLVALAAKLRAAIESDDDVHAQLRTHEEHLAAVDAAASFDELIAALDPP